MNIIKDERYRDRILSDNAKRIAIINTICDENKNFLIMLILDKNRIEKLVNNIEKILRDIIIPTPHGPPSNQSTFRIINVFKIAKVIFLRNYNYIFIPGF